MSAALGGDLIFDVHAGRAELDEGLHGARDVECGRTKTGVDVDQQGQRANIGDATHVGEHVVEPVDPEIGDAERARGDAAARKIDGAKPRCLGETRVK